MKEVVIYGEYIQFDQFLKMMNFTSSGGQTAAFLASHKVLLNGIQVHEKRKKVRKDDKLTIDDETYVIVWG